MAKQDISVRELVDLIKRNELRLPELQRRYVWTAPRVRDLLDSLYRGYPSGAILVWETSDESIPTRALEVGPIPQVNPFNTYKLLLDGQQRLTSLSAVMRGEPVLVKNRVRPIEILFNLEHPEGAPTEIYEVDEDAESEEYLETEDKEMTVLEKLKGRAFVVGGVKALKNDPVWISVSDIFVKKDNELLKPIGISSVDDPRWEKYSERLAKVRKIAEYPYVMHVLEPKLSYNEVAEIFVRVNSLGAKLRSSDLALAQITANWRGALKEFDVFGKEMEEHGYDIDTGLLVRSMVVMATNQSRFRNIGSLISDVARMKESWEHAKRGLQYATNFLRTNADVDSLELLSSPLLIIPIAVSSVMKNEKFTEQEIATMLKWFFLAHVWRHYGRGSSETILDADLSSLKQAKGFDPLIQQIKQQVGRFEVQPEDLENKDIRSSYFSMMFFVMKRLGAKDWFNGLEISHSHSGASHSLQFHHIFPKARLKKEHYPEKLINDIANFAFIGGKTNREISAADPAVYLKKILDEKGEAALKNQLVPLDQSLWSVAAYPRFLEERRKLIATAINDFLGRLG